MKYRKLMTGILASLGVVPVIATSVVAVSCSSVGGGNNNKNPGPGDNGENNGDNHDPELENKPDVTEEEKAFNLTPDEIRKLDPALDMLDNIQAFDYFVDEKLDENYNVTQNTMKWWGKMTVTQPLKNALNPSLGKDNNYTRVKNNKYLDALKDKYFDPAKNNGTHWIYRQNDKDWFWHEHSITEYMDRVFGTNVIYMDKENKLTFKDYRKAHTWDLQRQLDTSFPHFLNPNDNTWKRNWVVYRNELESKRLTSSSNNSEYLVLYRGRLQPAYDEYYKWFDEGNSGQLPVYNGYVQHFFENYTNPTKGEWSKVPTTLKEFGFGFGVNNDYWFEQLRFLVIRNNYVYGLYNDNNRPTDLKLIDAEHAINNYYLNDFKPQGSENGFYSMYPSIEIMKNFTN